MTAIFSFVPAPGYPLVRVGRKRKKSKAKNNLWTPKRWSDTPPDRIFNGRFDDPRKGYSPPPVNRSLFRMIYCAGELAGSIAEVGFYELPDLEVFSKTGISLSTGVTINSNWCRSRKYAYTTLDPDLIFVDLTTADTVQALRENPDMLELLEIYREEWQNSVNSLIAAKSDRAYRFDPKNFAILDRSIILGQSRRLTQEIARIIYKGSEPGGPGLPGQPPGKTVGGIRFASRHPAAWECWALFYERIKTNHTPQPDQFFKLTDKEVLTGARDVGLMIKRPRKPPEDPASLLASLYP